MKKLALLLALNIAIQATATAADSKILDDLSKTLNTIANLGKPQAGPAFSQNVMSNEVRVSFSTKLQPTTDDQRIYTEWEAIIPLAARIVGLSACGVGPYPQNGSQNEIEAWKSLGRWIDPDVKNPMYYGTFPLAVWHTQYHSKSSCMSILRTDRWTKPSKNTLSFRAQFVSTGSDETVNINYLFKILDDGTWVLNNAYL
ncbi:hypothetical protein [Duganella fentianensis]|uniref:hypothetical protein n=1 Tax=Duganella fentianensis TaxID=2692177 RepID=UPI0032B20916